MKKILITGSTGFIGRNLVEGLNDNYKIYAPKRSEINLCDTKSVEKYLVSNKFDVIIHTANQNFTKNITTTKYEILNINLKMFFNLERCKEFYGKMYYLGSGAEYDMNNYIPMMKEEYFGVNIPSDPYGFSKYIMTKVAEDNNNIYNLRLFGIFGKYEEYERRFISNAICRTIFDLPITINQNVYFDYLYIDDLVRIMKWFIENIPLYKQYNICTGRRIDLLTIAEKIIEISRKDLKIEIANRGFKKEYTGNNNRLLESIKQFDFTNINEAIECLYKYYQVNKESIDYQKIK